MNDFTAFRSFPFFFGILLSFMLLACQPGADTSDIEKLEAAYQLALDQETGEALPADSLTQGAEGLIAEYEAFVKAHPKHPSTPNYLFRISELYEKPLANPYDAIEVLGRIVKEYPEHELAGDALFNIGYIYHNTLMDLEKAKATYSSFINRYQEHELIPSAKFEIQNLGVSNEEIFLKFQQESDSMM